MRRLALVLVLAVASCRPAPAPVPPPLVVVDSAAVLARDSLAVLLDSSRAQLREQRVLVRLAEQQMGRYARIVARECPAPCGDQRRFLVGWTRRAFSGVVP